MLGSSEWGNGGCCHGPINPFSPNVNCFTVREVAEVLVECVAPEDPRDGDQYPKWT